MVISKTPFTIRMQNMRDKILDGSLRFLQVPSCSSFRFFQVPSGSFWFLCIPSGSFGFLQVLLGSFRFFQVSSSPFKSLQVLSYPFRSLQATSNFLRFLRVFRLLQVSSLFLRSLQVPSGSYGFLQVPSGFLRFFHFLVNNLPFITFVNDCTREASNADMLSVQPFGPRDEEAQPRDVLRSDTRMLVCFETGAPCIFKQSIYKAQQPQFLTFIAALKSTEGILSTKMMKLLLVSFSIFYTSVIFDHFLCFISEHMLIQQFFGQLNSI